MRGKKDDSGQLSVCNLWFWNVCFSFCEWSIVNGE